MEERVFIGVGSNIDPRRNILEAAGLLAEQVRIVGCSTFYRTASVERPDQGMFLNGVFEIRCSAEPRALKFEILRPIEASLGRKRGEDRYAAREIDLDVLVYGSRRIDEPGLKIPDDDVRMRAFVAVPLRELAPELTLPDGERIDSLDVANRKAEMEADTAFTDDLKVRLGL